jgi:hypothetical protein
MIDQDGVIAVQAKGTNVGPLAPHIDGFTSWPSGRAFDYSDTESSEMPESSGFLGPNSE